MLKVYNKEGVSLDIRIRLARQDDTPQLIALLRKQHGKNYPNRHFYDQAWVRRGIEEGILCFAVVELPDGTLAGMAGCNAENIYPGSLKFMLMTIVPSLRGFGLGKHLHHFLLQIEAFDKYTCLYMHCLTLENLHLASVRANCCIIDCDLNRIYFARRSKETTRLMNFPTMTLWILPMRPLPHSFRFHLLQNVSPLIYMSAALLNYFVQNTTHHLQKHH